MIQRDMTLPFASEASGGAKKLEPDYTEAFKQWQTTPTPATRSALLKKVKPAIDTAVLSYAGQTASPSLRTQAKLMALKAMDSYDPGRGSLRTHLISQLQGLRRLAGQERQVIAMPERVALDQQHLAAAHLALTDKLGRDPTDHELADHTGMSRKRINYVRLGRQGINTGNVRDEHGEVYNPSSGIPGDTRGDDAWESFVYHDLSPIDQLIMDHTLGRNGKPVLAGQAIARKLGLTPGAISQRKAKIQQMLDERSSLHLM